MKMNEVDGDDDPDPKCEVRYDDSYTSVEP